MSNFFALPGFRKYFANTSLASRGAQFFGCQSQLFSWHFTLLVISGPERFGLLSYALNFCAESKLVCFPTFLTVGNLRIN